MIPPGLHLCSCGVLFTDLLVMVSHARASGWGRLGICPRCVWHRTIAYAIARHYRRQAKKNPAR